MPPHDTGSLLIHVHVHALNKHNKQIISDKIGCMYVSLTYSTYYGLEG